jgi:uncharacterized protein with HEPN domain
LSVDRAGRALAEILEEIRWLEDRVVGTTFEMFVGDRTLRYAVERSIEIISEASRRIPEEAKALRPDIPWRAIAGVGNILRHEYHAVAPRIVWDVVARDLPGLARAVEEISSRLEMKPGSR